MVEKQNSQLNLAVVALVALVAIVGLVALVMNAATIKQLSTGSKMVAAQPSVPGPQASAQQALGSQNSQAQPSTPAPAK